MGRLIEPVGHYAENPYYIAQTGTFVFCAEELCFVFCQYPFLLDRGILDKGLVKWLDEACGLKELAKSLNNLLHRGGSPSEMVSIILNYVNYGTEKERKDTEELLQKSADMDAVARRKSFADYLTTKGKYQQAVTEYGKILEEIPAADHVMRSKILHNRGVALCRLFFFEEAAQDFLEACREDSENTEAAIHYLGALRMSLSEEEYISFIADNAVWYEPSLKLEQRLKESRKAYEASFMQETEEFPVKRSIGYYETVSKRLAALKEEYRKMAAGI